ncbi:MAG: hypothetical protein ACLTAF_12045 [Blautia coccoides]
MIPVIGESGNNYDNGYEGSGMTAPAVRENPVTVGYNNEDDDYSE